MDPNAMEAKIAKTEQSIKKLEKHLTNRTCPISLQYSAKPNITPDIIFHREVRVIKQRAQRSLVQALTSFHKRRLESQRKRASSVLSASTNKHVNRQPLKRMHSSNIVNNNDEIASLRNDVPDLKELINTLVNKNDGCYNSVFSDSKNPVFHNSKSKTKTTRRKERRITLKSRRSTKERETNEKFLNNLSDNQLTDSQVSVLSKGLKFIPTPVTIETIIRRQLLRDFEQFARRMRLQYIFHGQNNEPHPFLVKSNWMPPVQPSVALESYLENVKAQLAEITVTKPRNNLSRDEIMAIFELKNNSAINLKKADKGTTTVIMNKTEQIKEAQVQLDNRDHYKPLKTPIVKNTQEKVNKIINRMHRGKHIDDMTKKWFIQTPYPPRIPIFYTLTKIHKPIPVGRPIISGFDGPTERISSFVDTLPQPIAQTQLSYIKDTTDFINFLEKTKIGQDTILVSMDVSSLYTNILQEEGMNIVCKAYEKFHKHNTPIPTHYLREMLGLILNENSFQFNGGNFLQTHGTAMGTKMAVFCQYFHGGN